MAPPGRGHGIERYDIQSSTIVVRVRTFGRGLRSIKRRFGLVEQRSEAKRSNNPWQRIAYKLAIQERVLLLQKLAIHTSRRCSKN